MDGELLVGGTSASSPLEVSSVVGKTETVWSVQVHEGAWSAEIEVNNVVVILSPWSQGSTVALSIPVVALKVGDDEVGS